MELPLPIEYKGVLLDCGYRMDLLVESTLLLELKSVESILPIHEAQILSYMHFGENPHWPPDKLQRLKAKERLETIRSLTFPPSCTSCPSW